MDVNEDGKLDITVANNGDGTLSVLENTTVPGASTPSFAAQQTFATGSLPVGVAVADLNGDSKPDFLVADSETRRSACGRARPCCLRPASCPPSRTRPSVSE